MKTQIWYMRPSHFPNGIMGWRWCEKFVCLPDATKLEETHVLLMELQAMASLDKIYNDMQAENWSPNGAAAPFIREKGLQHTSMSVGDIIVNDDGTFMVDQVGFKKL
jgi:hypothetical protein